MPESPHFVCMQRPDFACQWLILPTARKAEGPRNQSKARKPWSANRELRGWQRRGLSRQVSRGAWKRCINRELEAKMAHKPWIREGLNREVQTVNKALSTQKIPVFEFTMCTSWFARPWTKICSEWSEKQISSESPCEGCAGRMISVGSLSESFQGTSSTVGCTEITRTHKLSWNYHWEL